MSDALGWMDESACRDVDINVFYPENAADARGARDLVCGACPVSRECYEFMAPYEGHRKAGVWGGTTAGDRKRA